MQLNAHVCFKDQTIIQEIPKDVQYNFSSIIKTKLGENLTETKIFLSYDDIKSYLFFTDLFLNNKIEKIEIYNSENELVYSESLEINPESKFEQLMISSEIRTTEMYSIFTIIKEK